MKDADSKAQPPQKTRTNGSPAGASAAKRSKGAARKQLRYAKITRFLGKLPSRIFPQWLRTALMVFLWLAMTPLYVGAIATYSEYGTAEMMTMGLAVFSGLAVHLWPTRTSPWRTIAWALVLSMFTGASGLASGIGEYAVVVASLVGFTVVLLRVNSNGRKLWRLFQSWRVLR